MTPYVPRSVGMSVGFLVCMLTSFTSHDSIGALVSYMTYSYFSYLLVHLQAHVRDHHPRDILLYEDYESLRKLTCRELQLTYR